MKITIASVEQKIAQLKYLLPHNPTLATKIETLTRQRTALMREAVIKMKIKKG